MINNFSYLVTFDFNDYIFHKYFKNIISQYSKTTEADRTQLCKKCARNDVFQNEQLCVAALAGRGSSSLTPVQLLTSWELLTRFPSSPPGEGWGDWGDPVGLLLLPRDGVWCGVPGHPPHPPTAAREQLSPPRFGENLQAGQRWAVWHSV